MRDQTTQEAVVFDNVVKRFGDVTALKKMSMVIEPGKLVTLLGPSGCGKTTTLRLIAGLESATEGRILIGGQDVTHLSATYRKVSMVFQSYALFPHMTVLENVAYGLTVGGAPRAEAHAKAEAKLDMVGLKGFGVRLPSELSGGQQQRVAVARAIVLEPEVLLLDEPLSNLDAKLRRHVREEIRQIQQDLNLTAVYVTHDQEEAMAVSDRIIVMKNAAIAQEGTPHDLYERPNSAFIADFIGDANVVPCEVTHVQDGRCTLKIAEKTVTLPISTARMGAAELVLRPNRIKLSKKPTPDSFTGTIEYAAYLGHEIQYSISSELGDILAISNATATPFVVGDTVALDFDPKAVILVPPRG